MGNNHSNKSEDSQFMLASEINKNNNSSSSIKETNDVINKYDWQMIQCIKKDFTKNPELFILNNMLMGVMFFENYPKLVEDLKRDLLGKKEDYITPDSILGKVNENVLFRPHHGPKKNESEPLVPKRYFAFNDWVKVVGSTEDANHDDNRTTVRIEESRKKGYVRLRMIHTDGNSRDGHSPVLQIDSTEPNSRSSTDSSDNYYSELQELKTPKPIEIIRELERHESSNLPSGLPKSCISYRKIKKVSWDASELRGEEITEDDLFETVSYINSKSFIKQLQNNLFLNDVASRLGLNLEEMGDSRVKREKICCSIQEGAASIPCEIFPSIRAGWPLEQTLKFVMKRHRQPGMRKRFIFPTPSMIEQITSLDCVLLPKGQPRRRDNTKNADIEWELNFPRAQSYLETYMTHSQTKGLLVLLTLHKTYVEPKTAHFGLLPDHIRNFVLKECESNYSDWSEQRLGTKLFQLLTNLNEHLSQSKPNIPDFFIPEKNTLSDVSTPNLRVAQEVFHDVLQSPVMHFTKALRNLRYRNSESFFPAFRFKELHDILKESGLETAVPRIPTRRARPVEDTDDLIERIEETRRRRKIEELRKEKERILKEEAERRGSDVSIDLEWSCEKKFDIYKKRALLKFFIEHFLDISGKCLKISPGSAGIYIKQSYYLSWILLDQCPAFKDDVSEYWFKIQKLERQNAARGAGNAIGSGKTVAFAQEPQVTMKKEVEAGAKVVQGPRKSVAFVELRNDPK